MPRCGNCRDGVPSECLEELWKGVLVCSMCRVSLFRSKLTLIKDTAEETAKENPMAELKKHLVASINVFEIETVDGTRDHLAEVQVGIGGLNVKYDATFDQIRDFFTKRREQKPGKVKLVS
jgi:hypothetical protein